MLNFALHFWCLASSCPVCTLCLCGGGGNTSAKMGRGRRSGREEEGGGEQGETEHNNCSCVFIRGL